jgi:hypothetical protein
LLCRDWLPCKRCKLLMFILLYIYISIYLCVLLHIHIHIQAWGCIKAC